MTQDEVLNELRSVIAGNQEFTTWTVSTPHLVELVNRAIKAEREACAKVVEDIDAEYEGEDVLATWCAAAIRQRGQDSKCKYCTNGCAACDARKVKHDLL